MQLLNRTGHAAGFFNTVIDEDRLLASVVCRSGFVVADDGVLQGDDGEWVPPVDAEAWETPYGSMDGDQVFLHGGMDLLVFGQAHAPGGEPCRQLRMEIRAGADFRRELLVTGDRVWRKGLRSPKPSDPEPFRVMPLVYERAFGGTVEGPLGPTSWSPNPVGRGFAPSKEQAVDQPLPNIEDPATAVSAWDHRPDPVGVAPYPRDWSLRIINGLELDGMDQGKPRIKRIKPELFNNAHPQMIIDPPLAAGDEVAISHLTPTGPLAFRLPDRSFHLHVQLEDRHHLVPLHLEAVGILGDERRVFLTWRACFRYRLVPMERRAVELHAGPVPERVPGHYQVEWDGWSGKVLA